MDALDESLSSPQGRRSSVRIHLLAFGAAILVPVVVFASVLLWRSADSASARFGQEALAAAQRFVTAVAASPHLQTGNFDAFQRQAQDALRILSSASPDKLAVVLRDTTGRQVADTRLPWSQALPERARAELDQTVAQSRRSLIRDLFGLPPVAWRVL